MEATLERVRQLMSGIAAPQHYDKVYKDECAFTMDTPFSPGGLGVNLRTWCGVGADVIDLDVRRNGGNGGLYLVQKFHRKEKEQPEGAEAPKTIGMLLESKYEVVKEHSLLVVGPSGEKDTLPYPCEELPMIVSTACEAIIAHQGSNAMEQTSRFEQDQGIKDSKYANDLVQLPPTRKISPNPKDWKCEVSGDTQNLWLNLSDGFIGGGRKFFDGSGGSNGALDHFKEEQSKGNFFPLVVKLGTITAQGADVYSYAPDEDDLVKDPHLAQHLAHWGIDVMRMEKTDKSMAEMETDFNLSYDWSKICESGEDLVRVRGPGLVGLKNLGNSCYLNSTVQLLLALPEAKSRYLDPDYQIRSKSSADPATDLVTQVAKLTNALNTDRYAPPWKEGDDEDDPKILVAPAMFRALIGKGHPEFSSGRQQDAAEFLQYFLEQLSRSERGALGSRLAEGAPFASLFEFAVEERMEETGGVGRVAYSRSRNTMLGVPVKLDDADNLAEVMAARTDEAEKDAKKPRTDGDAPKPIIQLSAGLARFAAAEDGIPFRGALVSKTTRMATMPRYLLVQVQRYYLDEKWVPSKLDCRVPMPDKLNLEHLRGSGRRDGEAEFPEDAGGSTASAAPALEAPQPDEMIVVQLLSMGIGENAAKRAALAVQNANAEAATAWYFEHSEDPDVNDPVGAPAPAADGDFVADPSGVAMLSDMGFAAEHVKAALKACGNSTERAADWLFSHADDLDGAVAALSGGGGAPGGGGAAAGGGEAAFDDGKGEYSLVGFVSHIGTHTACGHYVCHAKRGDGKSWVIFNDQKVAQSGSPPLDLGYLYLYRRDDAA